MSSASYLRETRYHESLLRHITRTVNPREDAQERDLFMPIMEFNDKLTRIVEPLHDAQGTIVKWYGTNTDIDDRKRAEALLAGENEILEMVATGKPLGVILDGLCRLVDNLSSDSLHSILLFDPNGNCLRRGAGPRFPEAFMAAVDGIEIGPCVGSCGTATYRKEQVIVSDIETSPRWANYLELARAYGLRAGWSTPILSSD